MNYKLTICVQAKSDSAAYLDEVLGNLKLQGGSNNVEVLLFDYGVVTAGRDWRHSLPSGWRYIQRDQDDTPDEWLTQCLLLARGDYCWMLNGYDVLAEGAVQRVLAELGGSHAIVLLNSVLCDIWLKPVRREYALDESLGNRVFSFHTEMDWVDYLEHARSLAAAFAYQPGVVFATAPMQKKFGITCEHPPGSGFAAGLFAMLRAGDGASLAYIQQAVLYSRSAAIIEKTDKLGDQIASDFVRYFFLANHDFSTLPQAGAALIKFALRGSYPWAWSVLGLGKGSWGVLREKLAGMFDLQPHRWPNETDGLNAQRGYAFYQIENLLSLQVHDAVQAAGFMQGDVSDMAVLAMRHERARMHSVYPMPCVDLLLVRSKQQALFNLLAVFVDDDGIVHYPVTVSSWPAEILRIFTELIRQDVSQMQHNELRLNTEQMAFPLNIGALHSGRAIPCLADYTTVVNHIKRYRFSVQQLQPGRVLDCACGVGYGASIMVQNPALTEYVGVDLDDGVTLYSSWLVRDSRCSFKQAELASLDIGLFENVVSLETIEHVPDPDGFLADLAAKLAPGGQLILSLPVERWAGTHMNPHHLTNWTYARFSALVERYFEECTIYRQKLSLLGPDTFAASEIVLREHVPDEDEGFIAVLRRPRQKALHRIFVRRRNALGDVLLTTPIVRALRLRYPESLILLATDSTQAYQNNLDVDVLGNMQLQPRTDDLLIDLDGCYEQYRDAHILRSYAAAVPVVVHDWRLQSFPDVPDYAPIIAALRQLGWAEKGVSCLIGVHMAATSPDRIWPVSFWQQWFERVLSVSGIAIIIVGHGHDFDVNALTLTPDQSARVLSLVGKTAVQTTAAALSLCDFVVAPDSGMTHLANSVGVRTLVLFGMADPATRLPLDGSGLAIWSPVECRGCLKQMSPAVAPLCRFGKSFCMEAIGVDSVWHATKTLLALTQVHSWLVRAHLPVFPDIGSEAKFSAEPVTQIIPRASVAAEPALMVQKVSIIICSIDDGKFTKVSRNYTKLLHDVPHEIIRIADAKSLCEGYNRGIEKSTGDVLIFSHDDIEFIVPDFWWRLRKHLGSFDMVGVAGTTLLSGPMWGQSGMPFVHGLVVHKIDGGKLRINCYDVNLGEMCTPAIQAVDGVFFAVRRRVINEVHFDEETFDGFHFYDLDFSYRVHLAGFKIGVCRDLTLIHDSFGGFDSVWEYYAYLFATKYKGVIPQLQGKAYSPPHLDVDSREEALAYVRSLNKELPPKLALLPSIRSDVLPMPEAYHEYWRWEDKVAVSEVDAEIWAQRMVKQWHCRPIIHLLMWLVPGEEGTLASTLGSLANQFYTEWRLTVVTPIQPNDSLLVESPKLHWQMCDPERRVDSLNQVVSEVNADWVMLLVPGGMLEPHALLCVADYINAQPDWQFVYCDDDRIGPDGSHFDPQFKPDFNPDLLRAIAYMGESVFVRRTLLLKLGGYANYPGWENYYLSLGATFALADKQVGHIARVLMHYPRKRTLWPQEEVIGQRALQAALDSENIPANVEHGLGKMTFRVNYEYPGQPLVSILIPTRDKLEYLRPCVESVLEKTAYPNFEILIADNQSCEPETLAWFIDIQQRFSGRVKVLPYDAPFNFSAICNFLVQQSRGEYVLLLNNDTLVVQDNWLGRLLSIGKRPDVGVVGCRLIYPDKGTIQHAGIVLGFNDVAGHVFEGLGDIKYAGYMQRALCEQNFSAVTAAVMLVRRSVYEAIGGIDATDLSVLYNDVDLCLKAGQKGFRVVYTPYATLMHHAGQSMNDVRTLQDAQKVGAALDRKERERRVFWKRWRKQIAHDPAWNVNLSLRGAEGKAESVLAMGWDVNFHDRPRVVGVPLTGGAGEYRVISPLRALRTAGLMQVTWATSYRMFRTRVIKEYELARLAPDTILMHVPLDDEQILSLESFKEYVPEVLRVATFDDLLTHVPEKNSFKKFGFKDVERRLREVARLVDRCIVTTEPLRECLLSFGAQDVRVLPNCLEMAKWGGLKSSRGKGQRPRVGWAGAQQHLGDLELIAEVVRTLAQEVEWVFFGMCPDELRPYVHEFHDFERNFDDYPAKLASLNLDLALAPLEIHPFNEAKSNLRLLEYGIMGWPVVCTDIYPYQNAPVKRVENKSEAWVEAILERVRDLDSAKKEGDALRDWVLKNYAMEDHLDEWLAALVR